MILQPPEECPGVNRFVGCRVQLPRDNDQVFFGLLALLDCLSHNPPYAAGRLLDEELHVRPRIWRFVQHQ